MSRPVDLYIVYQFLKRLTTPFNETEAYKLGIIDETGKKIKKTLTTGNERDAYTLFDKLVFNIKKVINKIPGGRTKFGTYAAALLLLKEGSSPNPLLVNNKTQLIEELQSIMIMLENDTNAVNELNEVYNIIMEEAPANAVAGGGVAGVEPDDPPMPARRLLRRLRKKKKKKQHQMTSEGYDFKKLQKNRVPLDDTEREKVLKAGAVWHFGNNNSPTPAIWKTKDSKGKVLYACNTHRAFDVADSLDGCIKNIWPKIKETA